LFRTKDESYYNLYHKVEKTLSCAYISKMDESSNLDPKDLSIQHNETIKNTVRFYSSVAMI